MASLLNMSGSALMLKAGGGAIDYSKKYLTMEILVGGNLAFKKNSASADTKTIYYKKNGGNWTECTASDATGTTISTSAGDIIEFKGTNSKYGKSTYYYVLFSSSAVKFNIYGNIMSLINGDDFVGTSTITGTYCFASLLRGSKVVSAKHLVMPSVLGTFCFQNTFYGCTSLVDAPELRADSMTESCYNGMFYNCTSLVEEPVIRATTAAKNCCWQMFYGCTSLTKAPVLKPLTLSTTCYHAMFDGCSSLNYIKALFKTTPSSSYTQYWVRGVASSGTFVKNSSATWNVTGNDGIPSGWTVQTASS